MREKLYTISLILVMIFVFSLSNEADSQKRRTQSTGYSKTSDKLQKNIKKSESMKSSDLPGKVDLSKNMPTPGNQGEQGSCVAWSAAFAYKTYHENIERKWGVDNKDHIFSPAYVYNQIKLPKGGSYIHEALELIKTQGVCPWSVMPYNEKNDSTKPSQKARQEASKYRAKSWAQVDPQDDNKIKKELSQGNPVIFGMALKESFYEYKGGIYRSQSGGDLGGHAMVLVGYDDSNNTYKIINSWSTQWGDKGYLTIDRDLWKQYTRHAYVMYDDVANEPNDKAEVPQNLSASEGSYTDMVKVIWEDMGNAEVYKVFRTEKGGKNFKEIGSASDKEYLDRKIKPGQVYVYSVKSMNKNGLSDFSNTAEGFAQDGGGSSELGQVQNVQGWDEKGVIRLSWNLVDGAQGYNVKRFNEEKDSYDKLGSVKDASFTDKKVEKGKQYYYVVSAYSGSTNGPDSDTVSITVPESKNADTPKIPQNFNASKGDFADKVVVSWDSVDDASAYFLFKWNASKNQWVMISQSASTSYEDKDVEPDVTYYYTVCSGNSAGYSEYTEYKDGNASASAAACSSLKKKETPAISEKASEYASTAFNSKGAYTKVIPFKDANGKKIKEDFIASDNTIKETGIYKQSKYYDRAGNDLKIENYYTDSFGKQKGYNLIVSYYDGDKKLREERTYTDEKSKEKGFEKRIDFIDESGKVYKSEMVYNDAAAQKNGYFKKISYLNSDIKVVREEFYDKYDNKLKENTK